MTIKQFRPTQGLTKSDGCRLRKTFPRKIEQVIVFGSRVNGDAREYSDYDVLVIVNHPYDWRFEHRMHDATYDINLKYDLLTDLKIMSTDELKTLKGKLPFIQAALEQGAPA
jgi:predicted nucleotidyltransferase